MDFTDPGADDSDRTDSDSAGPQYETESSAPYTDAEEEREDEEGDYLEQQFEDYDDAPINFRDDSESESEASWPVARDRSD